MAYVTGTVADQAALLTALKDACVANGWSYTGNTLHKGHVYVLLSQSAVVGAASALIATMGKGMAVDGLSLTDPFPYGMAPNYPTFFQPTAYPLNYDVHVFDTEVYLVTWDSNEAYTWLAFGQSSPFTPTPGAGNNLWIGATAVTINDLAIGGANPINLTPGGGGATAATSVSNRRTAAALFAASNTSGSGAAQQQINTVYTDSVGVLAGGQTLTTASEGSGMRTADPLLARTPNVWNGEALLIPIQVYTPVASTKRKLDIQVVNARYFRLSTRNSREVFTVSAQPWKVYPWHKLNRSVPNAGSGVDHTGTLGWAIKYTGP